MQNTAKCRGGVTHSQHFFATLQCAIWKWSTLPPVAILKSLAKRKRRPMNVSFSQNCVRQVAMDMSHHPGSHAANCLTTLRKVEDSSAFLATRNVTFCCIAGCKNGVLHVPACNLQCNVCGDQVARKIAPSNMAKTSHAISVAPCVHLRIVTRNVTPNIPEVEWKSSKGMDTCMLQLCCARCYLQCCA